LAHDISFSEKLFIGKDLNDHVGKLNNGYERNHGGFGFRNRNKEGSSILDLSIQQQQQQTVPLSYYVGSAT
jgi:hypothetical protein